MLLLKTLSAAQRNGDTISWGVNQDGKTNGITAPSTVSQTELAQRVYQRFAISPDSIELIEAHGTGTKLGDPIEIRALKQAFSGYTTDAGYCALGSVKSSIGHGLASAGVAGTIKVLLALQHKVIPPLTNFTQLKTARFTFPPRRKTGRAIMSMRAVKTERMKTVLLKKTLLKIKSKASVRQSARSVLAAPTPIWCSKPRQKQNASKIVTLRIRARQNKPHQGKTHQKKRRHCRL